VIYRGRLVAIRDARTADKNEIGILMATGGREHADHGPGADGYAAEGAAADGGGTAA